LRAGRAIVEAVSAAAVKPRVLIQAPDSGYYGDCGDADLTEDSPVGSDFLAQVAFDWEGM